MQAWALFVKLKCQSSNVKGPASPAGRQKSKINMKFKKILITGGAGFIGSHLTDHLINEGNQVRIMDSLHPQIHPDSQLPPYLNKNAEFVKGDVTNREDWKKALEGVDGVVHFAAAVGVGQSMYEVERYVKVNSLGTSIFLDILANETHTVKKMLIAGSMTAIGEGIYRCKICNSTLQPSIRKVKNLEKGLWEPLCPTCHSSLTAVPTDETALLKSPSIYAITKKNQEEQVLSIGKNYGIPAVSLRFFNVFGPRQSLSNPYTGVTAIFLSRVKNNQPPVINEDGLQSRDFVSVFDVVSACHLALTKDKANYEIFHVGSGIPTSILEVAHMTIALTNSTVKPEITRKFRKSDVRHCFADTSKIQKVLGWKAQKTFEQGMKDLYDWAKDEEAEDKFEEAQQEMKKRGLS